MCTSSLVVAAGLDEGVVTQYVKQSLEMKGIFLTALLHNGFIKPAPQRLWQVENVTFGTACKRRNKVEKMIYIFEEAGNACQKVIHYFLYWKLEKAGNKLLWARQSSAVVDIKYAFTVSPCKITLAVM